MSKSKCETELEKVKTERDHWRKLAERQGEQIGDLKRSLERMEIHAGMFGIDMVRRYDAALERLQKERDTARADTVRLVDTITNWLQQEKNRFEQTLKRFQRWNETLGEAAKEQPIPHLAAVVLSSGMNLLEQLDETFSNVRNKKLPELGITLSEGNAVWSTPSLME
ncbi:MAG: hypothetical protein IT297_08645 [Anaerolineae bacterium]|nr:hypothetical protein [Anaerolineae bacterium]